MALAHDVDGVHRTQDIRVAEDVTFDSMLLTEKTLQGLKNSGFYYPSPIQLLGIPLGKCGFDLLLEAKSGTGKTAVFTIITLETLDLNKGLQTIILAPTREIAAQICDVVKQIGSCYKGLNVEVVIGGLSVDDDIKKFNRKIHVLVASPGRLRHLIQMNFIDISAVRLLVIDEADKLMEKSFLADINYIFSVLPSQKQVVMSSATYPEGSKEFICKYGKNFQHICPESDSVLKGVAQTVTMVKSSNNIVRQTQYRFEELLKILSKKQFKQCLIFCNYQVRVTELHKMLTKNNWPVELLYSKQEQTERLDALKTLQDYKCRILISTDLAARGIDASNVDLVINFEPPFEWQTYLHRIGRSGRFGSYGIAITLLSEGKEVIKFRNLLKGFRNSLTLNFFWTNETFELGIDDQTVGPLIKSPETMLESKITKNEQYAALWSVLTSEDSQNSKDIRSFENLMDSYETCKEKSVYSFTELVKSFDCMQDAVNEDHTIYTTVKVRDIPIEDILTKQLCITNGNHIEQNANISKVNYNKCNTELNFDVQLCQLTNTEQRKHISNHIYQIDEYKMERHSDEEDNYEETKKIMLNLGLPTCFSSKKTINEKVPKMRNNNANQAKNKKSQSHPITDISSSTQTKDNYKYTSNYSEYDDSDDEIVVFSHMRNQNSNSKWKNKEDNYLYSMWYNQFKSQIKNIEVALYINEMSKLNLK